MKHDSATLSPDSETVPSLESLMAETFQASLKLAYSTLAPDGHYLDPRDDSDLIPSVADKVWSWADGLMGKYYHDRATGHCSLSASLSFDLTAFENEVQNDLNAFCAELKRVGEPKQLTYADMQARGYRGAWAGYTPEQDRLFYLDLDRANLAKLEQEQADPFFDKPEHAYDTKYQRLSKISYLRKRIAEAEALAPVMA